MFTGACSLHGPRAFANSPRACRHPRTSEARRLGREAAASGRLASSPQSAAQDSGVRAAQALMRSRIRTLAACVHDCPLSAGVYRLYRGRRLLHIGMAAGAATVRSEVLWHCRGHYGPATQRADRVEWEVAPDALAAYRRFLSLYRALLYSADGGTRRRHDPLTTSRRHSARVRWRRWWRPAVRASWIGQLRV